MEKRISATQTVRKFSEVLNTVIFKKTRYIIERGGKPVASIQPIGDKPDLKTLDELTDLMKKLPRLGDELDAFAKDLADIGKEQPPVTAEDLWA